MYMDKLDEQPKASKKSLGVKVMVLRWVACHLGWRLAGTQVSLLPADILFDCAIMSRWMTKNTFSLFPCCQKFGTTAIYSATVIAYNSIPMKFLWLTHYISKV